MSRLYTKPTSMNLQSTQELITFLQEVQSPSSLTSQRWRSAGAVTAPMDWQTFCDLRELLGQECKYAYRNGTLTMEPPRSLLSDYKQSASPSSSAASLKVNVLQQLATQLRSYTRNGTSSGLTPSVYQHHGRALSSCVYRTADVYVGVSAGHNLDVRYDAPSVTGASFVIDVVTGEDTRDAMQGVDEWFAGDKDVRQVILLHCDEARVAHCRALALAQAKSHLRKPSMDKEEIGTVWRWGKDTRGRKVLLEEIKIMYCYAGYTDAPITLIDFARDLGVSVPRGERLVVMFDWNHALSAINTAQRQSSKDVRKKT